MHVVNTWIPPISAPCTTTGRSVHGSSTARVTVYNNNIVLLVSTTYMYIKLQQQSGPTAERRPSRPGRRPRTGSLYHHNPHFSYNRKRTSNYYNEIFIDTIHTGASSADSGASPGRRPCSLCNHVPSTYSAVERGTRATWTCFGLNWTICHITDVYK